MGKSSSLFGSDSDSDCDSDQHRTTEKAPVAPPGLYHLSSIVPIETHDSLVSHLSKLLSPTSNQSFIFSPFPPFLSSLVDELSTLPELIEVLPGEVWRDLFSAKEEEKLQAILNLYMPGSGILPHVDLPHRFGNVILGVSLLSSIVMTFEALPTLPCLVDGPRRPSVPPYKALLRPRDVYILSGPARYSYTHSIEHTLEDRWISESGVTERLLRRPRLSITLRRVRKDGGGDGSGQELEADYDSLGFRKMAIGRSVTSRDPGED